MSTITTFTGNLTADPELRFTTNGTPVLEFRAAVNKRVRNEAGEWSDGEPTWHNVKVWGRRAENAAESLTRGHRVNVHGLVETETWTNKEGEKRTRDVIVVNDRFGFVSPDLEFASVTIRKTTRTTIAEQDPPDVDPWATSAEQA